MKRLTLALLIFAAAVTLHAQDVRIVNIHSRALENNAFGDPADQTFAVYVPPGYDTSGKRYPVVYLLHGIADSYQVWTKGWKLPAMFDRMIAANRMAPMIVVMPNAGNRFLGGYYLNSAVSGRWEDYIAEEVVGQVDRTFRTHARASSRGIAGHSMGGFGAISIAMHRPDVFSAVYAISPCCLDAVDDVGFGNDAAYRTFLGFKSYEDADAALKQGNFYPVALLGLLSAFVPNPEAPLRADIPVKLQRGQLRPVHPAYDRFRDSFPMRTAPRYAENLRKLRMLRMDYGFDDQFAHIPTVTPAFSRVLTESRVPHVLDAYDGDHREKVVARLENIIFPALSGALEN